MHPESPDPEARPRAARLRLLMPLAAAAGGLAVFLALFWDGGHGRKAHARKGSSVSESSRSPVGGGSGASRNSGATGGSPVGGGPSRAGGGAKGETWWYRDGDSKRGTPKDAWWAPGKGGGNSASGDKSPVGGSRGGSKEKPARKPSSRPSDGPSDPSQRNPGEAAGQTGPDDFWWRN